jgi:indole-3-glycerol phosphate synthase
VTDKLSEIIAWKRREIAPMIRAVSEAKLKRLDASLPRPPPFIAALRRPDRGLAIIAEIKRRSPSAGEILPYASAIDQAQLYKKAGADALSVLTDEKFFGGTLDDLRDVTARFRTSPPARPCLRKDFMLHPAQVLEAREAGASAILIIVRALGEEEIKVLHGAARAAGLDSIFEIHDEIELTRALAHQPAAIGVNNRDLSLFKTDLALSERIIPQIPRGIVAISESGISTGEHAARARAAGADAILVGEALMKTADIAGLLAAFRARP